MPRSKKPRKPLIEVSTQKDALIESIAQGATVSAACRAANIDRSTFYAWIKSDEDFRIRYKETAEGAIQAVEDALWDKALSGNVIACIFYLCNRAPERWKNVNKVEIEKKGDEKNADNILILRDISQPVTNAA